MKRAGLLTCLGIVGTIAATSPAVAQDDPALISFGVGQYDQTAINPGFIFLKVSPHDYHQKAVDFRTEYRFGTSLIPAMEPYAKLKPWAGVEATSDGAVYGAGGILIDVPLGPFVFTPSFGAGLYSDGAGKRLGTPIEFRTMLEMGYQFENQSRFSLGYSHISNANISTPNPGTNMLSVYYHVPSTWLLGE